MISIIQNGDVYEIRFKYDPILIDKLKCVAGRQWHAQSKMWTIPKDKLGFFLNQIKGTPYESACNIRSYENLNKNESLDDTTVIPDIDISNVVFHVPHGGTPYPHQLDFMRYAIDKQNRGYSSGFVVGDDMGLGKALSLDSKVYTPDGFKYMRDIEPGDTVFDDEGKPTTVLRTYSHADLDMYKVTFSDNTSVVCCKDHLWQFQSQKAIHVWPLHKILSGPTCSPADHDAQLRYSKYTIPITRPVQFRYQPVPLDPYILGMLLSDDTLVSTCVFPSNTYNNPKYNDDVIISDNNHSFKSELESIGLNQCNQHTKFIPNVYKFNSIHTRQTLLYTLLKQSHRCIENNSYVIQSVSKSLIMDILWIVQSLGGIGTVTCVRSKYKSYTAKLYKLMFNMSDYSWFKHIDPQCKIPILSKTKISRRFKSIKYIGKQPGKCITVSGKHHLYLTNHFIVTHNTLESTNLAIYNKYRYRYRHCLIICNINTSKYNWKKEIETATNGQMTGYILGARYKKDGTITYDKGSKPKLEDLETGYMYGDVNGNPLPYFLICNVESLRAKSGRKYPFADLIIDYINKRLIRMIIIDEVHKNMSPTSTQGKQILRIKKATGQLCEWIPMTGTPIVRKPTDVFLPLKLIDAHNFSSYYTWCKEFCIYGGYGGHEILGYKNIPRLKTMLQSNMIRRLKDKVLDLPPKIYYTEYVDNTPYQSKLYESVRQKTLEALSSITNLDNPMVKFLKLRQVNGSPELVDPTLAVDKEYIKYNAKLQRIMELLEDIHDQGEKVIIFSNWVEPLRTVYKFVSQKYKTCCFTGTMTDEAREKNKQVFQNNPEYTVLIGTIGAAGTTHTFTAASNIIFLDEPWNATDKGQAEDRAYRIGTKSSLKIYTLLSRDTIDDRVHDIVYEKGATANYIVDNKLDFKNNPDLVYKLLGK